MYCKMNFATIVKSNFHGCHLHQSWAWFVNFSWQKCTARILHLVRIRTDCIPYVSTRQTNLIKVIYLSLKFYSKITRFRILNLDFLWPRFDASSRLSLIQCRLTFRAKAKYASPCSLGSRNTRNTYGSP